MGGEKQGSKGGGGYVGGFLQLFDWNAKSRKKLFSNKSDLPEQSKQKKRSHGNLPMTRFDLMDEDEIVVAGSSFKGCSNYSCASSVTDEEGYGTRAPGVVARLMGLDSLPASISLDLFSTPFFDSQSLQDVHYHRRNLEFHHDHQTMHSGNLHNKVEVPVQKAMEPKTKKMINRPIEKFQTEILPPKSAKSIPVTNHKLLSPIKGPGFIPPKNAAHIMEAAAKIIEPGPQATSKAKMPLLGNSSVPSKVRDLKEKVEVTQKPSRPTEASSSRRPVESNAAKFLKGQPMNKSWNGSEDTTSFRVYPDSEDCSGMKNKGKSVSLALQAKVNVQRREGLSPSGSRSQPNSQKSIQKKPGEILSSQPFRSQPNSQKSIQKKPPVHNASNVLRQNNQKQNCINNKEKLPSKSLLSNSQGRKVTSEDSSMGRRKNSSKFGGNSIVGSQKLEPEATISKKEVTYSSKKNVPRKKRTLDGNFHLDKCPVVDSMLVDKTEKPIHSNAVVDRHFTWADDNRRKEIDVVSFTFTAPLTRRIPAGEISREGSEKNNSFSGDCRGENRPLNLDSTNSKKLSSVGYNVIGADDLSILLEQKLRELTHGVKPSFYRAGMADNSASIFHDLEPTTPMTHDEENQEGMLTDKLGGHYGSNFSSTDSFQLMTKLKLQVTEEIDECGSEDTEAKKLFHCRHPSPISVLEPSFLTESCNSSDSADSNSTEGSKHCTSSVQAQEVFGTSSSKIFHLAEFDAELSDSASSTSATALSKMNKTALSVTHFIGSNMWELKYVKEILFNVELMFNNFALGQAHDIINPCLFDQLESRKEVSGNQGGEPKLARKVLFDCVSECMELKCSPYASGGCRAWAKGLSNLRRKERLAGEVYKEILGWRGLGYCMVDDLVDKDMSSYCGKWVDFETEEFELGVEIEGRILNSLLNELVADFLFFWSLEPDFVLPP